jgi:hypothetical protein
MQEAPAFASPVPSVAALLRGIDLVQVVSVAFAVLFVVWIVYTLVTGYHWLRYGHKSAVAIPALIVHVIVSGYLALFAVSGLHP